MSLVPREQETLTAIENRFRITDPQFAAMFTPLGSPALSRQGSLRVFLAVWVGRYGKPAAFALLAFILVVCTGSAIAGLLLA